MFIGFFDVLGDVLEFVRDRVEKEKQEIIRTRAEGRRYSSSNSSSRSTRSEQSSFGYGDSSRSRNEQSSSKHRSTKEEFYELNNNACKILQSKGDV